MDHFAETAYSRFMPVKHIFYAKQNYGHTTKLYPWCK